MKYIILLGVLLVVFSGCIFDNNGDGDKYMTGLWAAVDSIMVNSATGGIINVTCIAEVGDPCHEYEKSDITYEQNDVYVRLYSKREKAAVCPDVISSIKVNLNIQAKDSSVYHLHFWQGDSASLDTSVIMY